MIALSLWDRLSRPFRSQTATVGGGELGDELMSHFRSLVMDKVDAGMPLTAAWDEAESQFGSVRRYEDQCREQQMASRIRGGRLAMAAALCLSAIAIYGASTRMSADASSPVVAPAVLALADAPKGQDFTGRVLDAQGQPVADATVLVILKTWPNNRYQQQDFSKTTDKDGRFEFKDFVPKNTKYAIHCTALKDGYAFRSDYQLAQRSPFKKPESVTLKLNQAVETQLALKTSEKQAAGGVTVAPGGRKQGKDEHLVYFQGSEPVHRKAGDDGRITLKCFEAGDKATLNIQASDDNWIEKEITIPENGGTVEVALDSP